MGRMETALIVSSSEKGKDFLENLLKECGFLRPAFAANGGEARRLLLEQNFDLVVINAPLQDEFGHELAMTLTRTTDFGILLMVKAELLDAVSAKVEDYGVFVIPKPIGKQLFFQTIKLVNASRKRVLGLRQENGRLQQKIEEMRLIDRAKCTLIQYLGFTEQQAHRYLEKQAMDLRVTRREVAEQVLRTYETR